MVIEISYSNEGLISNISEFVFSSLTKEKLLGHQYIYRYSAMRQLKQVHTLRGSNGDTVEIDDFDGNGNMTTSLWNYSGLRTKKIVYKWSKDSSECKEVHFEDGGIVYNTITSTFSDGLIINKIDSLTSPKPFYWKYDDSKRIIETNSGVFCIQKFFYNNNGLLEKQIGTVVEEFNTHDFPKTLEVTYEYEER